MVKTPWARRRELDAKAAETEKAKREALASRAEAHEAIRELENVSNEVTAWARFLRMRREANHLAAIFGDPLRGKV